MSAQQVPLEYTPPVQAAEGGRWKVKGLRAKKVEAGKLYYLVEWDSVGGQEWPTDWRERGTFQRRELRVARSLYL
eukprot:scaffold1571_cov124-Isochrysis_galbana.AAC.2